MQSEKRANQKIDDAREKMANTAARGIKELKTALCQAKQRFGPSRIFKVITVEDHQLFQTDVHPFACCLCFLSKLILTGFGEGAGHGVHFEVENSQVQA